MIKYSKVFSLTEDTIDDCVLPEHKETWLNVIKPRWFVMNDTEEAKREPGKN